jgi:two-component system cell cycle response regulator DivK
VSGEPVLVVDDNPQNLKLVRVLLGREGYQVVTAVDGEEALTVLESFRPRLILMDLQLPGLDGLSLTRRLKGDPATAGIIIIALTAYAMKGDREKALEAGCDDYVTKPIDVEDLCITIQRHLASQQPPG